MAGPIQVWRFQDAPAELRALSPEGGDEDWLAVIPKELADETWVDFAMGAENHSGVASRVFGSSRIFHVIRDDGSEGRIGIH